MTSPIFVFLTIEINIRIAKVDVTKGTVKSYDTTVLGKKKLRKRNLRKEI